MARCPSCASPLASDRAGLGHPLPRCRDPPYQPPDRAPRPPHAGEATCAVHAGSASVVSCERCGNFLCEVCRTRWRGQVVCVACVDRALAGGAASEGEGREHTRQAVLGLVLGVTAWALTGLLILLATVVASDGAAEAPGAGNAVLVLLFVAAFFCGGLSAILGLGQAVAALRVRGNHMLVAALGFFLCGLHVDAVVGLTVLNLWQS